MDEEFALARIVGMTEDEAARYGAVQPLLEDLDNSSLT
jgi:hypothetical protein